MKYIKYYFIVQIICITTLCCSQVIVGTGYSLNLNHGVYFNINGNWKNNGEFNSDNLSFVKLLGGQQEISGTNTTRFGNLIIDGTGDKILGSLVSQHSEIANTLIFNAQKIKIYNNDLVLLSNAVIVNPSNQKFIVTNGIGSLIKKNLPFTTDFLFPIGNSVLSYKPVILNNSGTVDTFAVRVASGLLPTTGADPTCVQFTYFIQESNPGGSNASLTLGWNTADEGGSFIRTQAYIWQYKNSIWNLVPGTAGANNNLPATNWYHKTFGIEDFSSFANGFILRSYQILAIVTQPQSLSTCLNNNVTFSVTASGSDIQYQWQQNCSSGWANISDNNTYTGTQTTALTVNNPGLGMNGCQYQCIIENLMDTIISQPVILTVHSVPQVFAGNDTTVFIGNSVQLNASGGVSYQWSPSTYLDNPNISNPTSTPLNNISYVVIVIDEFGCAAADTINIIIDESTDIFIPNAFAPEGNPINQVLYVRGKGIKELEFVVYDRWGEKVFESEDITHGWDGTYKGAKLSTAVFIYYVKVTYYNGGEVERKGDVTLIR